MSNEEASINIETFMIDISMLQPSQLYINSDKLEKVNKWIIPAKHNYDSIPIKKYDNELVLTDGHTRALSMYLSGEQYIKVHWDNDEIEDDLYKECIKWCKEERIFRIEDLYDKIIDKSSYEVNWINRCKSF